MRIHAVESEADRDPTPEKGKYPQLSFSATHFVALACLAYCGKPGKRELVSMEVWHGPCCQSDRLGLLRGGGLK